MLRRVLGTGSDAFVGTGVRSELVDGAITADKIASNAITDAKIAVPAEAAGLPTGILGMIRRVWEKLTNKEDRDRTTGEHQLYGADNVTVLETRTQSTTGTVDEITKGS
jgi:hypothetical protein